MGKADTMIKFCDGSKVLKLGQGTWNMGCNPLNRKTEETALRCGIDLGMNVIDTAEMYENEQFIGNVIKGIRENVFIVSKVLPTNASRENTIKACEQSLKRLSTDYIDLFLLHWKGKYPFSETIEAMNRLVEDGKIRMWGVSNIDTPDMKNIDTLPGSTLCAANEVLYNLTERTIEYDLIPWGQENAMPIIAYSPIAEGELLSHPVLRDIANQHNATPAQIALAWTIRLPWVMAIPKAGTVKHVQENFKSLDIKLSMEDLDLLDKTFPPPTCKTPLKGW